MSQAVAWDGFAPFSKDELDAEAARFVSLDQELTTAWEEECAKYEETTTVDVDGTTRQVPRRNYINPQARVQDESLFPYHSSCYALLDAYDNLYTLGRHKEPVSRDAVPAHSFPPPPRYMAPSRTNNELSGYLPCSLPAISAAILQIRQVDGHQDAETTFLTYVRLLFDTVQSWIYRKVEERPAWVDVVYENHIVVPMYFLRPTHSGPVQFPSDRQSAQCLLLKLLKHAMSEIQRDHMLAVAILCRLSVDGHYEDLSCYRQVLTILASEYLVCEGPCDEPEDHACQEMDAFSLHIGPLFGCHKVKFTRDHGLAIAGFVRVLFLREFGHLMKDNNHSVGEKLKTQLKRNLTMLREESEYRENDTSQISVPIQMVLHILRGLARRALMERCLCNEVFGTVDSFFRPSSPPSDETVLSSIQAFQVCVATLLAICDSVVNLLPPVERFYPIASTLVLCFAECFSSEYPRPMTTLVKQYSFMLDTSFHESYMVREHPYLEPLSSPFRFAENVRKAATLRTDRSFPCQEKNSRRTNLLNQCRQILRGTPPDEVRVLVRQLFVRDMVHLRQSRLGFGDFLVWCRYDVNPLDPALYCHEFNYPVDDDDDESDNEDDEDEAADWDVDETDKPLSSPQLRDMFDFSLLALQCEWHEPWTPESHPTFQSGFRSAVGQVALFLHRMRMPGELHGHIVQYFNRDWWPDERAMCWNYDCMVEQVRRQEECRDTGEKYVAPTVKLCSCGVTAYCSKACRDDDWKGGGHKRMCGKPPYCRPSTKEYRFCELIRQLHDSSTTGGSELANEALPGASSRQDEDTVVNGDDEVDDDDGSWESVDSDEEMDGQSKEPQDATSLIVGFFKSHYRDR